jgi:hypothetical protein
MKIRTQLLALAAVSALGFGASNAFAAATIINSAGTLAMGINDLGHLNTSSGNVATNSSHTGISYNFGTAATPDFRDATSPGCLCEGWGVSVGAVSGYANEAATTAGLNLVSFTGVNGGNTATSVVEMADLMGLTVTHVYSEAAAAPGALFSVKVTIKNDTGAKANNVKYVRVMDWDVPPTEFSEFVTIKGTGTTTLLEKSHLNGFASSNPLDGSCDMNGCGFGGVDVDVEDAGATDHGAYFRFNFGSIEDGEEYSFEIFYGAAGSEADALAAITAAEIELYSLGQSSGAGSAASGRPATYIFGFAGVGGVPVGVSAPGTLALAGLSLLAMGALRRRQA